MDISTLCVETPPNCGVRRQITGKLVYSDDQTSLYHTHYEDDCNIKAIALGEENSKVLKRDNSTQICNVTMNINWMERYEVFLYLINISNSNETYLCSSGYMSRSVCVGDSSSVEVNIEKTPIRVIFSRENSSFWKVREVKGIDQSTSSDIYNGKKSEEFSPHSQVARIGINNRTPESLELTYN